MKKHSSSDCEALRGQIAVMVVSCDNYSDLWNPFFTLFRRFWPDCPFRVYLLSNSALCEEPGVSTITLGNDVSWSDNLREGLRRIQEQNVLLWIDDLFLLERVDTEALLETCRKFVELEGNQIKLNPTVKADKPSNDLFGIASRGTIYRASTVMTLWKKDVLQELLRPGETAWDFEIHGTVRSDAFDGFYATWQSCFPIINCVIKGKWRPAAYKKIRNLCQGIDLGRRSVMTKAEEVALYVKIIRAKGLSLIPAAYRRKIKDCVLFGRYNYRLTDKSMKKS